jgi:hypothetical protein
MDQYLWLQKKEGNQFSFSPPLSVAVGSGIRDRKKIRILGSGINIPDLNGNLQMKTKKKLSGTLFLWYFYDPVRKATT